MDYTSLQYKIFSALRFSIINGEISKGDKLKSVKEIETMFSASEPMIEKALQKLEDEGYVALVQGARAEVVFNNELSSLNKEYKTLIAERKEEIAECLELACDMIAPLLADGVSKLSVVERREVGLLLTRNLLGEDFQAYFLENFSAFISFVLKKENAFISDLVKYVERYVSLPIHFCLTSRGTHVSSHRIFLLNLAKLIERAEHDRIEEELESCFRNLALDVQIFIEKLEGEIGKKERQNDFEFIISKKYWPNYNVVFSELARKIIIGDYVNNEMLPSEAKLSETYGVSTKAVRNAIKNLNDMNFTVTKNGVGTVALLYVEREEHYSLSYKITDVMEFVNLTIKNMAKKVFRLLKFAELDQERRRLERLYDFSSSLRPGLLFVILDFLAANVQNDLEKDVLQRIVFISVLKVKNSNKKAFENYHLASDFALALENAKESMKEKNAIKFEKSARIMTKLLCELCDRTENLR